MWVLREFTTCFWFSFPTMFFISFNIHIFPVQSSLGCLKMSVNDIWFIFVVVEFFAWTFEMVWADMNIHLLRESLVSLDGRQYSGAGILSLFILHYHYYDFDTSITTYLYMISFPDINENRILHMSTTYHLFKFYKSEVYDPGNTSTYLSLCILSCQLHSLHHWRVAQGFEVLVAIILTC